MATVVNNPAPAQDSGGSNFLIGVIIVIGFVIVLSYVGFMAVQRMGSAKLNIPAPQVVVPDKIDVNVTQEK